MTRRRAIPLLAVTSAVLISSTALGADRSGNVAPGGAPFAWESGPMTGLLLTSDTGDLVDCDSPGKDCDDTLLNVGAGQLTVKTDSSDPATQDVDLYVYPSDAQGAIKGDGVSSAGGTPAEEVTVNAKTAGFYLVRVVAAAAAQGTYTGEAKELALTAAPTKTQPGEVDYGVDPADPDAGKTQPASGKTLANDLAPSTTARAPASSQSRVLRGTASDPDGKVAYVDIALVRVLSKSCRGLRPNGTFAKLRKCTAPLFLRARGTKSWHYTLRHKLPKGTYRLYARATDNVGRSQGGFNKRNRVTFKVT